MHNQNVFPASNPYGFFLKITLLCNSNLLRYTLYNTCCFNIHIFNVLTKVMCELLAYIVVRALWLNIYMSALICLLKYNINRIGISISVINCNYNLMFTFKWSNDLSNINIDVGPWFISALILDSLYFLRMPFNLRFTDRMCSVYLLDIQLDTAIVFFSVQFL